MNRNFYLALSSTLLVSLSSLAGCTTEENQRDDEAYAGCTIEQNDDNSSIIRCADGTEAVISHGKDGEQGEKGDPGEPGSAGDAPCTLTNNDNGTQTLTCGTNSVVLGNDCEDGYPGSVAIDMNGSGDGPASSSADLVLFKMLGCTSIQGNLHIYSTDEQGIDPAILSVTHIGGLLEVYDFGNETFELPNLQSVGGGITFAYTTQATSASFPVLQSVGYAIRFESNDSLTDVSFPALESVGDDIVLTENDALASLSFPELQTIEGSLTLGYDTQSPWYLATNPALNAISFPLLKEIQGDLTIFGNDSLVTLEGMDVLESVGGDFTIAGNPVLEDVGGLINIAAIKGNVTIVNNEVLDPCPLIRQIESLPGFGHNERPDDKLITDALNCAL